MTEQYPPSHDLIDLFELLARLLTADGIQASTGELYQGAIFGRDSLRVALDLLPWFPSIAERVLFSLLRYQGTGVSPITEEEPGKIHHEYRHQFIGSRKIKERQQQSLEYLASRWGGTNKEVIYYGSVDATPQLVRLITQYCQLQGTDILEERFLHRSGQERSVGQALIEALNWISDSLANSSLGLVEFKSKNPKGLFWHVLRDGKLSYIHADGSLANRSDSIASLDVQALAYDALIEAAYLLADREPERSQQWKKEAKQIQESVLAHFWREEEQVFAMAIDRDNNGQPRQLAVASSVMADVLDSRLLLDLPAQDHQKYVRAIVKTLYGADFLTPVGIRNRSLAYADLVPLWDYHGSFVSWGVINNIFALGLRRQGLFGLAEDMEARLLYAARKSDSYAEFFYVDKENAVYSASRKEVIPSETDRVIYGTNVPESIQAWTVSSLLRIILSAQRPPQSPPPAQSWQTSLQEELAKEVSLYSMTMDKEWNDLYQFMPLQVDVVKGREMQETFLGTL